MTGQDDRQSQILSGKIVILAGNCLMTGRYFEPWVCVAKYNQKEPIRMLRFPSTITWNMIKCCDCIKVLSLTLRVNSLIFRPLMSLSSQSRSLTIFHWRGQPAKGTLTRTKSICSTFLTLQLCYGFELLYNLCAQQIPEDFLSKSLQQSEFRALEIFTIS